MVLSPGGTSLKEQEAFTCGGESWCGVRDRMDLFPACDLGSMGMSGLCCPRLWGTASPPTWSDHVWLYLQVTPFSLSVAMQHGSGSEDSLQVESWRNLVQFCPPLMPFWWQPAHLHSHSKWALSAKKTQLQLTWGGDMVRRRGDILQARASDSPRNQYGAFTGQGWALSLPINPSSAQRVDLGEIK